MNKNINFQFYNGNDSHDAISSVSEITPFLANSALRKTVCNTLIYAHPTLSPVSTGAQLDVFLQIAVEKLVIINMKNARCENI